MGNEWQKKSKLREGAFLRHSKYLAQYYAVHGAQETADTGIDGFSVREFVATEL